MGRGWWGLGDDVFAFYTPKRSLMRKIGFFGGWFGKAALGIEGRSGMDISTSYLCWHGVQGGPSG